jgi:hypothetical protein
VKRELFKCATPWRTGAKPRASCELGNLSYSEIRTLPEVDFDTIDDSEWAQR